MKTYGVWSYSDLVPFIELHKEEKVVLSTLFHGDFLVGIGSARLTCLKRNNICVSCGKAGVLWMLQSHKNEAPHLNLYAFTQHNEKWKKLTESGLLLMTQDHIRPKSRGGGNSQNNLQTMCAVCNSQKGDSMPKGSRKVA